MLFPSVMDRVSKALSSALCYHGIRADAARDPTEEDFKLGQGHTSGKDCLPAGGGDASQKREKNDGHSEKGRDSRHTKSSAHQRDVRTA